MLISYFLFSKIKELFLISCDIGINQEDINILYIKIIKKGDTALEHFYCVFLAPNNNIVCMCSIFYFLDLYAQQVVTKETVTKLYTYQVLNS